MAESHVNDVPIARQSEKLATSRIQYVKFSKKPGIRWLSIMHHTDVFRSHKIVVLTVTLSIVALLLFSASFAFMELQWVDDYPPLNIERITEDKPTTEYDIFENDPKIYGREKPIDQQVYGIISEYLKNPRKREIRKIQKRQARETKGLKNYESSSMGETRLHRVQTGSKIPREVEIIRGNDNFFKEIYNDSDENRNKEKREIEKKEKIKLCKRSVEHCKSVLNSMQSLVKTTGDNVESLNKLVQQIRIKEETKSVDPHKFQDFMQCVECNKITYSDSISFPNDLERNTETGIYNHPVFHDRQSQMTNTLEIAEILNNSSSNADIVTDKISKVEETKSSSVVPSKSQNLTDGGEEICTVKKPMIIKQQQQPASGSRKEIPRLQSPSVKNVPHTEISTRPSLDLDFPRPFDERPRIQVNDRLDVPSATYNLPGPRDSLGWTETTRTQATVEESSSGNTMALDKVKSDGSWNQKVVSRMSPFDPRIMTGTQHQPVNGIYGGSSMVLPTAETTQTGQQVQYTPPVPWMPYPICFFGSPTPVMPSGAPIKQSMPGMITFPSSPPPGAGGHSFSANQFPQGGYGFSSQSMAFGPMQYHQQGFKFGPGQKFPYGNPATGFQQGIPVGPTASATQGFLPNYGNPPTGPGRADRTPYYCTYMPAPTYQFPPVPGISEFQRNAESPQQLVGESEKLYNPPWTMPGMDYPGYSGQCGRDYHRCDDGSRCVSRETWCNGRVDCPDASDETKCSCRDRVNKDRICDGYFDCPRGEDELGCFGCPANSFSCEDWNKNDRRGNCVTMLQRCDGLKQCPNGKDEMDCTILTQAYIENRDFFTVGYTTGYLHKNWQGRWYPVCTPTESWAMDACVAETGFPLRESPRIDIESTPHEPYHVSYLAQSSNGEIKILPTCYDKAIYVRCPKIPCGTRVFSYQNMDSSYGRNEDALLGSARNVTGSKNETRDGVENIVDRLSEDINRVLNVVKDFEVNNETEQEIVGSESRVVGGKPSQPKAWPFLVAIRKDGYFNCGGVIINEEWILTAAHCVDGFPTHYYEIQAGLLRRFSFSPMAQSRRASYIKMHPGYERIIMKNDLALIRLDEPLLFNRWIRPTCLPKSWLTETHWRREPLPDTTCVIAGWGATVEHGPDPDHLREVEVPISRECKQLVDRNDAEICAGIPQGGRDACQGDSGGPLMCSYPDSENQWYVAGIVSHGEGCGRPDEPGAYTKVSRFVDWIDNIIHTRENVAIGGKPLTSCPGFSCGGGLGKCLPAKMRCDRIVNCLDAEDEINCGPSFATFREPNVAHDNRESIESEFARPVTKNFIVDNVVNTEPTNIPMDETSTATNPQVFTVDDDEKSTTKILVESTTTTSTTVENNNVTVSQQTITTTKKPQSSSPQSNELRHFTCTRLIQSLPIGKRCNRVIDCEDGTDEDNCSCKDYLANSYPKAICNGYVDCHDGSDEEDCGFCRNDEFVCSRSGTCVPRTRMCDHRIDCPNKEDELDCFALTNGDRVITDFDMRPHLNLKGVATQWKNGNWRPVCVNRNVTNLTYLSSQLCVYFGFGSAESVEKIQVRDAPMEIKASTKGHVTPDEYPPSFESSEETGDTCTGIYIRCRPVLSANTSNLIITNPRNQNLDYLWPWQASIFVNGLYHCPAILLEHSWLLATSRCVQNLDLKGNYTMALVGMAPAYLYVDSPYQQMASIDSIKILEQLDAALLHLGSPVNMTRYVQPIFLQKRIFPATRRDVCVATGVDEKYKTRTTFLQPVPEQCPQCHRCYKNATFEECKNETLTNWSGTIVCRGSGTWYPAAIFHEKDMLCGFQSVQTVTGIDYGNAHFTEIMEENLKPIAGPNCDGYRCPLGKCISWDKVCDGIDDCRDASDESVLYCEKRKELCKATGGIGCKCTKSELRCANGQCVPKEAFCDYKIDCDDSSDETPQCTCADYLKLTAPERLCNNVRDCFDKSDESSEYCPCKDASFKCSDGANITETCVPQDYVCDGEPDCPNGEDEKICRTVKGTLKDPRGTGEVLRRSFGVWYSECFPSPVTSTKEISDLCRTMGYNIGSLLTFDNEENPYGPAMIPENDEFFMIRMNRQTWITMRYNRPLVNLVVASETCHRAFVKCS